MAIDYAVKPIKSTVGKEFVIQHHYSHGIHNGPTCYGLFDNEDLIGVLAIATPCSENVRASLWGPDFRDHVTELHRLVVLDGTPKNTESYFISRALKLHKQAKSRVWGVLSFADATEGHRGTIYQATNALFLGTSGKATFFLDETGRLRHPRQNGVNISRQDALERGWTPTKREGKYRYLFLLPDSKVHRKRLLRDLRVTPQPYPRVGVLLDDEFFKCMEDEDYVPDDWNTNKYETRDRSVNPHAWAKQVYWLTVEKMLTTAEPGFSIDVGENARNRLRGSGCGHREQDNTRSSRGDAVRHM